ncbi:helix-turn-helix domain-containing protein [Synoicihabitans lomoniglobus]|uniref:AraC family transcriptional regulator n=1 Tax=Synoicihabitans lomoniglobus TaxID=2909285 RepID=A0AAE9ZRU1_9BACT|nr:AraC family transcriptional regulator [Opitutaceae bacterium LMO-M01]WED64080.1 AraC family transcriptional regulator [Opitutaceae bacterium LMO-M01]
MQAHRELIRLQENETFRVLRWNRSVVSVDVIFGRDRFTQLHGQGDHWHYHPALELTLIQSGKGTRLVGDDIDLFESGDLVLIGPNVPHYWHMRGNSSGLALQWDFPSEHGIWNFPEVARLRDLTDAARRGVQLVGNTALRVRQAMEEIVRAEGLTRLGIFLKILGMLVECSNKDRQLLSDQPFSISSNAQTQEIIQRAVSYILAHHREPMALNDLLELTGMSRATFARQFLLHAGKPFSTFRNQVRLQAVCHALKETNEPVSNIALDHGFNQLSFFNRLFNREFGMNPSTYRRRHRSGLPLS